MFVLSSIHQKLMNYTHNHHQNLVRMPESLLKTILLQIHYINDSWKGQAHTPKVKNEFSQLFQYQVVSWWWLVGGMVVVWWWLVGCF